MFISRYADTPIRPEASNQSKFLRNMHRGILLLLIFVAGVAPFCFSNTAEGQSSDPLPTVTPQASPMTSPSPFPGAQELAPPAKASPAMMSPSAKKPPILNRETIARLKIFLDQHSFGPGEIDDHWTNLCANALRLYQSAMGQNVTGQLDPGMEQELNGLSPLYITYQIKPEDFNWVGKSPSQPAAQAKLKAMPYPSIAEFVAERFHTNQPFLAGLNRGKNLSRIRAGDTVQVPNVPPLELELLRPAEDIPPKPELSARTITVDTKNKVLEVVENGKMLAAFPITPGSKQLPAPIGNWTVTKMTVLPWFRWDRAMLLHGRRSGEFYKIHPGPRNEVGLVWVGLNKKGIGIHGTNRPDSIGRSASHGCIRLANWDAVYVLNSITKGAMVQIQ
jgi:lipoprotein-anchoring transpeptidase ErfK/SrfK